MNESDIHVIYGSQNIQRMAYELMDARDVASMLDTDLFARQLLPSSPSLVLFPYRMIMSICHRHYEAT